MPNEQPHWMLLTVLGAVLGYLLPLTVAVLAFTYRKLFHRAEIEGTWHEVHFTYEDGVELLSREAWHISKGLRHKLTLRMHPKGKPERLYVGRINLERDHLLAHYSAKLHHETVVARFHFPATPRGQILCGIWMSFDHDGKITAGVSVLSETELGDDEAREAIKVASTNRLHQRVLQITGRPRVPSAKNAPALEMKPTTQRALVEASAPAALNDSQAAQERVDAP